MKKILAFVLASAMTLSLAACSSGNDASSGGNSSANSDSPYEKTTIRISTSGQDQGIDALAAKHFGELVEEATDGVIKVEVYRAAGHRRQL